ncbi:MAG: AmmeMemoRadiSam system protein B [Armatimonadota bacterium]|nr:AmmeMemoRadiSam system protein B [Armatimonadota bacterium]MCX7776602.1 AmmeMemoRadiSam system protein B [Armatimonadota bacterium]MDW8025255.1 AmmeMemoRadiSam system protein B [Armatimonadota bacterium]
MDYPKLRKVDIFPVTIEGRQYIAIRDPLGLMEGMLLLPQHMALLIGLMDGKHSIREIQVELMRCLGKFIMSDEIQKFVSQLDEHFLLENERSAARLLELKQWFREQRTRRAAHSGTSYPGDTNQLKALLDSFYSCPSGPGVICPDEDAKVPAGIMVPHIDLRRGGVCYAWAYYKLASALLARTQPTTFIILGIAHCQMEQPFTITSKDFETPFGTAKANAEFVEELARLCHGFDPFADELVHRFEHSIEFQVLFLQHTFDGIMPFTFVPILCGSFEHFIYGVRDIAKLEPIEEFVNALRHLIGCWHERICIISSVDLSHVGVRFGHTMAISTHTLQWLRRYDAEFLSFVEQCDADGMLQFIARNRNFTNIDATPATYVMLKVLGNAEGHILKYEQSLDPDGQSVVTFAAAAFYAAQVNLRGCKG